MSRLRKENFSIKKGRKGQENMVRQEAREMLQGESDRQCLRTANKSR